MAARAVVRAARVRVRRQAQVRCVVCARAQRARVRAAVRGAARGACEVR